MAVVITPKALQKYYQDLNYKILTLIGVNRSIGNKWRTLSGRYHGLDLPNFEVCALSKTIHFLQRKWDVNNSTKGMTETTHEAFMVEVGIYGNIFSRSQE